MASLKDLRARISSVKSTQKITKAMQMVAAAKLRRAQEAAEAARPYADRMGRVLSGLAASVEGKPGAPALLTGGDADKTHLLVVMTAERGLCGSFNASITKLAREHIARLLNEGKTVKILTVGKRGRDILRRSHREMLVDHVDMSGVRRVGFVNAQEVAAKILKMFENGEFDRCTLFFAHFKSVISNIPTALPLIPPQFEAADNAKDAGLGDAIYEYEPSEERILEDLLPLNVAVQAFVALLENGASEQGARMTAMDNATRNAGDMIDRLTLTYNRSRQALITKELIEIISGAEAV